MYLSGESLLIILLVGLIAGWLAGKIVSDGGFGFIGDIAIGIVGSLIGTWLLSRLGVHLGSDFLTSCGRHHWSYSASTRPRGSQRGIPAKALLAFLMPPDALWRKLAQRRS
jgi:uncharacterized membrane protein YeaQ/YmgE (transglycosylase-associated protein family)